MRDVKFGAAVLVALLVGSAVGAGVVTTGWASDGPSADTVGGGPNGTTGAGVATFDSASAFQQYVRDGQQTTGGVTLYTGGPVARPAVELADEPTYKSGSSAQGDSANGGDSRYSSTNVQVVGIDEPDRLKTTSGQLYYADQAYVRYYATVEKATASTTVREGTASTTVKEGTASPGIWRQPPGTIHVIDSSDPASPREITGIDGSGTLLLAGDTLVVFQGNRVLGYDVSDPQNPQQSWARSINGTVQTARLHDGTIYLVTQSSVSAGTTCPIEPLGGPGGAIRCSGIYYPRGQIPADVTYTAYTLDPASGTVTDSVSVLGTRGRSAIYMSENALYVTYTQRTPRSEYQIDALLSAKIETPDWVDARLREIRSYDLSARAADVEVQATVQRWFDGLSKADRKQAVENYQNGLQSYVEEHRRELVTTGIVRIGVDDGLAVEATGEVPGEPLNQFSMDEHDGTLRIATTIPRQYGADSVNDLYTLDADSLDRQGSVTNMGVGERVYAVRYVGDTAYVVTFRRTDPFHVVDLSDPQNPEEVGMLKLPGYSSYLHPLDDTHVLGIGEEDGRVKAVLFDVSDPADPTVLDTYRTDSPWSAIAQTHHAFLLDRDHGVFFLPGAKSGYVLNYTGDTLTQATTVPTASPPQRAAYVGEHLYVFSDRELVVVNESDWSQEASLKLSSN